ncbi:MAG: hypothetical protein J7K71_03605 [Candidatus Omnitrophica bacterium]|nr:hypothetical protein [Candidatus Omnitrophota bacterium]
MAAIVYISFKIFSPFFSPLNRVKISKDAIILEGKLNHCNKEFLNLISFSYHGFLLNFPFWKLSKFESFLKTHFFINTSYALEEFTDTLLKLEIPYWKPKGWKIEIFFPKSKKWYSLKDIISTDISSYSLERLIFLGLGLEPLPYSQRAIKEEDFLKDYFLKESFEVKNDFF